MYSPTVSAKRLSSVVDAIRRGDPTFDPQETAQPEAIAKTRALEKLRAEDGSIHTWPPPNRSKLSPPEGPQHR